MSVGGIDDDQVDTGPHQGLQALFPVRTDADRRPGPQAADLVLAGRGVLADLLDVLDGDQPLEGVIVVHHQQLLDAVLVQMVFGLLQGGARRDGDQVFLGHHRGNRLVEPRFEPQVAVGQNTHQPAASWVIGTPEMRYFFISSRAS